MSNNRRPAQNETPGRMLSLQSLCRALNIIQQSPEGEMNSGGL